MRTFAGRSGLVPLALCLGLLAVAAAPAQAAVPAGFVDELVTNIASPTGLAFTPDGRLLITTQPGALRVYQSGALLPTAALNLSGVVCANSERGLLGVAVDPAFASNRFIYLYYTFRKSPGGATCPTSSPNVVNRVSRFVLPNTNVVNPATERVLIDNIPSWAGNHNGGDVQFGRDGYLYISVGDGGCDYANDSGCAGANDAARDQHILLGKILRIDPDGAIPAERIPPTNPFIGADSETCALAGRTTTAGKTRCQETFAWGLRNPFRIAFDPASVATRFFINDVGQNLWEEIDEAVVGADYGWNCREGAHTNSATGRCAGLPPSSFREPIHEYDHSTGCESITGGAFVPTGSWPATFDGAYVFSDYVCGQVSLLQPNGTGGYVASTFATGLGGSSAVALLFGPAGPNGALLYTTFANGGQVRRIRFTGSANRSPVARITATPASGSAPLLVSFDASGSSDPDAGDSIIAYFWNFGDGSATVATATPTTSHLYAGGGTFTAALAVVDEQGAASDPVTVIVSAGNEPPVPSIVSPSTTTRFRVGEVVTLTGTAMDADEGQLPDSSLSWTVLQHHNDHTHPFLGPVTGNNIPLITPPPEDLAATETSFLEVRLTATDRLGARVTVVRNLLPHLVNVTLTTAPAGLNVVVNGVPVSGTVVSWEGYELHLDAPTQTDTGGRRWFFSFWSDAGARSHTIVTPAAAAAYGAVFSRSPLLDWNGDSKPDVVWQDRTDGFLAVWYLDGADVTGTAVVTPSQVPTSWTIAGAGDFNGDGKPDILWQDRTSGVALVWFMDGAMATGLAALIPSQVTTNWRIAGVADVNGDGKPDILWQDETAGNVGVWIMDGVSATTALPLVPGSVATSWRLAGAGDFNGDGKPDLVWHDVTDGLSGVWFMDGVTRTGFSFLNPAQVATTWRIAGVADLNGDGKPDILWQDETGGFVAVWFLNGVNVIGVDALGPGQVDLRWQIVLPK